MEEKRTGGCGKKIAALLMGTAFLFSMCVGGCGSQTDNQKKPENTAEGRQEPEGASESQGSGFSGLNTFTADVLGQGTFTQEDLAGKDVTAINFWSLTCGPCIAEMPDLAAFEKSLPDNVQLLTSCLDGEGAEEDVKAVMEQAGFEGITLLGGDGDYERIFGEILYTPTTVFVDKDGNMVGDVIIGGQQDLAESYGNAINGALRSIGKEEISFGK